MCSRAEAQEIALGVKKVARQADLVALGAKNLDALMRYWEYEMQVARAEHRRLYHEFARVREKDRARAEIAGVMRLDCASFLKISSRYIEILREARKKTREPVPYVPFLRPTTYLKKDDIVHDLKGVARVTRIETTMVYQPRQGLKPEIWVSAERIAKEPPEETGIYEALWGEIRFSLWDETVFRGDEWLYLQQNRDAKYLILSSFEGTETARIMKEALS